MQNTNRKAYILLWSIFLSLLVSISFISISAKINKNIRNNGGIQNNIESYIKARNVIKSDNKTLTELENGEILSFDDPSSLNRNLKKDELIKIIAKEYSNIEIILQSSGVIYYSAGTNSGIVSSSATINSFSGNLNIENLGGYVQIKINSDKDLIPEYTNYKISKKIGNKIFIKTRGQINNF